MLAGLWGAGLGAMHLRGDMWFLSRVEATMTDIRTVLRGQRPAPDLVTIVVIDDELVRNEGGYPLERATIARILDAIDRLGPKAVAIDLLLADRGTGSGRPGAGRDALQEQCRAGGSGSVQWQQAAARGRRACAF